MDARDNSHRSSSTPWSSDTTSSCPCNAFHSGGIVPATDCSVSARGEPLLRAIVQIPLDPSASLVGGATTRARRAELGAAFSVRDRGGDQLRELLHAGFGAPHQRREVLAFTFQPRSHRSPAVRGR